MHSPNATMKLSLCICGCYSQHTQQAILVRRRTIPYVGRKYETESYGYVNIIATGR